MKGYLGAKSGNGVYHAIIAAMPWHDIYVEACLGSGQILIRKPKARISIACDRNATMCEAFISSSDYDRSRMWIMPYDVFDMLHLCRQYPKDTLVYIDPPYPQDTRTGFSSHHYGAFEWDEKNHIDFLKAIQRHPAKIMVSTYPNDLYEEYLTPANGWRFIDIPAMTRGGPRIERLYMNFPQQKPHWHTYAGKDYIERQRIQRKAATRARLFSEIENEGEKLAVLAAILESYADPT